MPKSLTPRAGLSYGYTKGEGPWNLDMDLNMRILDTLLGGGYVLSNTVATPPSGGTIGTFDSTKTAAAITLSNSNLTAQAVSGADTFASSFGTVGYSNGKYYFEITLQSTYDAFDIGIGVGVNTQSLTSYVGGVQKGIGYVPSNGQVNSNSSTLVTVGTATNGSVLGMAVDCGTGKVWVSINGVWQNSGNPATGTNGISISGWAAGDVLYPGVTLSTTGRKVTINFGATAFAATAPSGFSAWTAASVVAGDTYIIPASATGVWAGKTNQIAVMLDGSWVYIPAKPGWRVRVMSDSTFKFFNGTAWVNETNSTFAEDDGFVDGNFDSWQRGTTFTLASGTSGYTADMWVASAGDGNITVARSARAVGVFPSYTRGLSRYTLNFKFNTATTSTQAFFAGRMSNASRYAGTSITVSGSFKAAATALISAVNVTQFFGSGGSPSASVTTTTAVSWNITTTEQKFSVRVDVPSTSGKTLGTNGDDYVQVSFVFANGQTATIDASQVQIDPCDPAAPTTGAPAAFRYRGPALEQQRIIPYFEVRGIFRLLGLVVAGASSVYSGASFGKKVRSPATTVAAASTFQVFTPATGWVTPTAVTVTPTGLDSAEVFFTLSGGATAGQAGMASAGDSLAIILDSRL